MFGIDGIEFFIILIVIVVVVGPKDLPEMMRAFGQAMARMILTRRCVRQNLVMLPIRSDRPEILIRVKN